MGRLVDQDYLWLCESSPQSRPPAWRRGLPFLLVPVAAIGVWYAFYTNPDVRAPDAPVVVAPLANRLAAPSQGRLIPAVAHPGMAGSARAVTVSNIQPWASTGLSPAPGSALSMAPAASLTSDVAKPGWQAIPIEPGDTLSLAFARHGLSYMDSLHIAHLPEFGHFFTRGLKAGRTLQVKADSAGRVDELVYGIDAARTVSLTRHDDTFEASLARRALEHRRTRVSGTIRHSFYRDTLASGLNRSQVAGLNRALAYDVDFDHDIHPGDRFTAVYDALYRDGHRVGRGPVLAVSLQLAGQTVRAIRYTDAAGHSEYYRPNGQPMRQAFVRAPVDYTRISSPFNLDRRHPILHRIRRHEGTDYAAPEGTPIHATGAGHVVFAGRRGGYGNVVILRHDRRITMRFAHMSRFARGLSVGDRVAEGEVIGYVGMTGLATGPHVHYEFRVNGQPRNPQTVHLPGAAPLSGRALARFQQTSDPLLARLDAPAGPADIQVARAAVDEDDS